MATVDAVGCPPPVKGPTPLNGTQDMGSHKPPGPPADGDIDAVIREIIPRVYDWEFNVFDVAARSGQRPLYATTMALLEANGLLDGWLLDRGAAARFFAAAEAAYNANPYHNATHAADVAQTAAVIMRHTDAFLRSGCCRGGEGACRGCECACECGADGGGGCGVVAAAAAAARRQQQQQQQQQSHVAANSPQQQQQQQAHQEGRRPCAGLSRMERFCVIFASAVHDLGHPGLNNDFLIRSRAPQAILYNDRSVNENMHCARAFELALAAPAPPPGLFDRFSDAEFAEARALIVAMVLSTDMAVHFDLLARFSDLAAAAPDAREWDAKGRSLALQTLVHLADLANPARPFPLARRWAERVVGEFLAQGDAERAAGLSVSAPCDRERCSMPAAQLGFLRTFAAPTLDAFAGAAAPGFLRAALPCLAETRLKWQFLLDAGVRFPSAAGGYPGFTPELEARVAAARAEAEADAAERERRHAAALEERRRRRHDEGNGGGSGGGGSGGG